MDPVRVFEEKLKSYPFVEEFVYNGPGSGGTLDSDVKSLLSAFFQSKARPYSDSRELVDSLLRQAFGDGSMMKPVKGFMLAIAGLSNIAVESLTVYRHNLAISGLADINVEALMADCSEMTLAGISKIDVDIFEYPHQKFPLMRLPIEIRNVIYGFALPYCPGVKIVKKRRDAESPDTNLPPGYGLELFRRGDPHYCYSLHQPRYDRITAMRNQPRADIAILYASYQVNEEVSALLRRKAYSEVDLIVGFSVYEHRTTVESYPFLARAVKRFGDSFEQDFQNWCILCCDSFFYIPEASFHLAQMIGIQICASNYGSAGLVTVRRNLIDLCCELRRLSPLRRVRVELEDLAWKPHGHTWRSKSASEILQTDIQIPIRAYEEVAKQWSKGSFGEGYVDREGLVEHRTWRARRSYDDPDYADDITDLEYVLEPLQLLRNVRECQIYLTPVLQSDPAMLEIAEKCRRRMMSHDEVEASFVERMERYRRVDCVF